jgi:hypothetical protein
VNVQTQTGLVEYFFEILHGVGTIVGGEGTGLSDWVDVPHIPDWGRDVFVLVFDEVVDFFIGGVGIGDQVLLVEVGVIGPGCVGEEVPKPLKG